jgi:chromosomal replication initiation ATPase DnaA
MDQQLIMPQSLPSVGPSGAGLTPVRADRICRIAAEAAAAAFAVSTRDLYAARRGRADIAFARQTAMYLGHTVFGLSFTALGRCFRRDRTTAAHACQLVEDRREDPAIDALVAMLESCCTAACNSGAAESPVRA